MLATLIARPEWQFATVLPRAAPLLAGVWWVLLILRGLLPAAYSLQQGSVHGSE